MFSDNYFFDLNGLISNLQRLDLEKVPLNREDLITVLKLTEYLMATSEKCTCYK